MGSACFPWIYPGVCAVFLFACFMKFGMAEQMRIPNVVKPGRAMNALVFAPG
jgi:hypothetical protein